MSEQLRREFEAEFVRLGLGEAHFVRHFNNPDDYLIEHVQNKWKGYEAAAAPRDKLLEEMAVALTASGVILEGLAAAVEWEIAPAIMREIREKVNPKIRTALASYAARGK